MSECRANTLKRKPCATLSSRSRIQCTCTDLRTGKGGNGGLHNYIVVGLFTCLKEGGIRIREWGEGDCCLKMSVYPLRVCTCGECEGEAIKCEGKLYHTRIPLSCPFPHPGL